MSLSDATVRSLKPSAKPYKRGDANGLYLLITPTSKLWRLNFMRNGKQKTAALGSYPALSLAGARAARDQAKAKLRGGIDPVAATKTEKAAVAAAGVTFQDVGADWYAIKMVGEHKSPNTLRKARWLLDVLNAGIGSRPIAELEAPDLLEVLRRVEAAGHHEAVARLRGTASTVFRFGIATGACRRDPAADLKGATTNRPSQPRSAIVEPTAVGKLLRDIDRRASPEMLKKALQLLMLVFVRPGELMGAEWSEIDFNTGVWVVPANRMKMRREFHIPLSKQALAIFIDLRKATGANQFVFPSRKRGKHVHADKLTDALRVIGYREDEISAHGFRSTASTILNEESKFSADTIELCLAHKLSGVRAIYNRSLRWPERVTLMQWWADRLDELRKRGEVVALPPNKKTTRRKVDV
jgi:integrase